MISGNIKYNCSDKILDICLLFNVIISIKTMSTVHNLVMCFKEKILHSIIEPPQRLCRISMSHFLTNTLLLHNKDKLHASPLDSAHYFANPKLN